MSAQEKIKKWSIASMLCALTIGTPVSGEEDFLELADRFNENLENVKDELAKPSSGISEVEPIKGELLRRTQEGQTGTEASEEFDANMRRARAVYGQYTPDIPRPEAKTIPDWITMYRKLELVTSVRPIYEFLIKDINGELTTPLTLKEKHVLLNEYKQTLLRHDPQAYDEHQIVLSIVQNLHEPSLEESLVKFVHWRTNDRRQPKNYPGWQWQYDLDQLVGCAATALARVWWGDEFVKCMKTEQPAAIGSPIHSQTQPWLKDEHPLRQSALHYAAEITQGRRKSPGPPIGLEEFRKANAPTVVLDENGNIIGYQNFEAPIIGLPPGFLDED